MFGVLIATFVWLLSVSPPPLSTEEKTTLARIHSAVRGYLYVEGFSRKRFEHALPVAESRTWQALQAKLAPNRAAYGEIAFLLAYYRIDPQRNLARLLRPYRIYHTDIDKWSNEYPREGLGDEWPVTDIENLSICLERLYRRNGDLAPLRELFAMRLDGHAAEGAADYIARVWQRSKSDVLRSAAGSASRLKNLAEALEFALVADAQTESERAALETLTRSLRRLAGSDDLSVARSAKTVLRLIRKQVSMWQRRHERATQRQESHTRK